ncbi:MAG: class I SAM-dependent methyltransferase [Acetobacter sp.]|nr:class I SAM-dependent methyltransferase [Acetobacter sp.]
MIEYNTGNMEKYGSRNPLKQFMIKKFLAKLFEVLQGFNREAPMSLLDVGCGEGFIANFLYDNLADTQITACDFFYEALIKAKEGNTRSICFEQADIMMLKYPENSYDVVIATEVLEHLENPKKALAELMRVARRAVVVSVPSEPFFCLGNLACGKNIKRLGNPIDHINHWTYGGFKRFLRGNIQGGVSIAEYNCLVWTLAVIQKDEN